MVLNTKKLLSLLILSFSLLACKKEDKVTYPQTLSFNTVTQKTAVRLFANKVEIKDTARINSYIKRNDNFFSLQILKALVKQPKITFLSPDSAIFWSEGYSVKYSYKKSGSLFLFTSVDNYLGVDNPRGTPLILFTDPNAISVSPASGYSSQSKNIIVARGTYRNLNISVLTYISFVNYYSGITQFSELFTYNEFNADFVKFMGEDDTLAIQESSLNLKAP